MSHPFREEDIPVLTEVIEEIAPQTAPPSISSPSATPLAQTPDMQHWSEVDREILERKLQERILLQLQDQIDTVLEQQVRDVLADVLQTSVSRLADDIRTQLQASMEGIVAEAVAQEVAKLPHFKQ